MKKVKHHPQLLEGASKDLHQPGAIALEGDEETGNISGHQEVPVTAAQRAVTSTSVLYRQLQQSLEEERLHHPGAVALEGIDSSGSRNDQVGGEGDEETGSSGHLEIPVLAAQIPVLTAQRVETSQIELNRQLQQRLEEYERRPIVEAERVENGFQNRPLLSCCPRKTRLCKILAILTASVVVVVVVITAVLLAGSDEGSKTVTTDEGSVLS